MKAQELLIDVTANNLANVNTNGFKRSQLDFADQLYSTIQQAGSEGHGGAARARRIADWKWGKANRHDKAVYSRFD